MSKNKPKMSREARRRFTLQVIIAIFSLMLILSMILSLVVNL